MIYLMSTLHSEALARAAGIVGPDRLAEELGVTPATLAVLMRGEVTVPPEMFLRATEIITEAAVVDAAKRADTAQRHD
jgi:uncharacterized protein YggE